MAGKLNKHGQAKDPKHSMPPIAGGAPDPCLEIDGAEYERARRDPAVHRLLERADRYAESLRTQGKLKD